MARQRSAHLIAERRTVPSEHVVAVAAVTAAERVDHSVYLRRGQLAVTDQDRFAEYGARGRPRLGVEDSRVVIVVVSEGPLGSTHFDSRVINSEPRPITIPIILLFVRFGWLLFFFPPLAGAI